jgi:hypothetical protein
MMNSLALMISAALLVPTAAGAATYSAQPVTPFAGKRIVVRDISWACGPAACQGASEYSRPVTLCQGLVKQAGPLSSFVVDGRALAPEALDKCNSVARGARPATLARN